MKNNNFKRLKYYLSRISEVSKKEGILYILSIGINCLLSPFFVGINKMFKPSKFIFLGQTYSYFYHWYNTTWRNERAVEIPIVLELIKNYSSERILEVGNILSHYFPVNHDIVDKYEKFDGIINQDIVNFSPSKKYELIVSISTLEHVGLDEKPRNPKKILLAIENLKKLLVLGGKIVVTLPLGQNFEIDKLIKEKKIQFTKQSYLKRISRDNIWIEVNWENVQDVKYNYTFPGANGLLIGIFDNKRMSYVM